jgi:hypothetical protein
MAKSNSKKIAGTSVPPIVVQPMDPGWLTTFLSSARIHDQTISCIISALNTYNDAVNKAGKTFENDLKKCLSSSAGGKKPSSKK